MLKLEEKHPYRTHHCGELTTAGLGSAVRLAGRIAAVRDLGGLVFLLLHDASGEVQLVARGAQLRSQCHGLKVGWAVSVDGRLCARRPHEVNPNHPTGEVEIQLVSFDWWQGPGNIGFPAQLARMRFE